jgi:hypothetical protein
MDEEGPESEELQLIYDRIEALDPNKLESKAGELLYPLPSPPSLLPHFHSYLID